MEAEGFFVEGEAGGVWRGDTSVSGEVSRGVLYHNADRVRAT
jgi:hypothetical protein